MLMPGARVGPYEVREAIGRGGMGEVCKAHDTKLNRDVALKLLPESFAADPDRLMRFTREAQTLASLNHPNIAQVHGLEESGGVRAIVMELVDGEDLSAAIARGALPIDDALSLAKQIADALDAAHDHGIVHRDLKPANIKVKHDGTVKVLDFGLAKMFVPGSEDPGLRSQASEHRGPDAGSRSGLPTMTSPAMTAMGMILGTAAYMSPEQARGKPVDKRADIWAFGVVLYEMLTGRQMFGGETVSDVIAGVLTREIDWNALPANTPPSVRRLLGRCLERDRRKRLRDIGDARDDLENASAGPVASGPGTDTVTGRGRRTAVLVAGTAIAAVAATLAVMTWGPAAPAAAPMIFPITAPPNTRLNHVAISPDGRSLVFAGESTTGEIHLWLRQLDSREIRRLEGTTGALEPFWSPDSRFIGFFAESQLLRIEAATGVVETLVTASNTRGGAWNRDGTIVFGGEDLSRLQATGGTVTTALPLDTASGENAIRYPSFLPNGSDVLIYSRNAKDRTRAGLWVVSLDTGVRTHLTATASSSAVYVEPGTLLYRRDRYLVAHPFDARSLQFTGEPRPIAEDIWYEPGITAQTNISASNTGVVAFRTGGPEATDLAWLDREGGRLLGTEWEPKSFVTVALSPDGRQILTGFPSQGIERHVWLYDIPAKTGRQISSTGDNAGNHVFSDDGASGILGIIGDSRTGMWLARFASGSALEQLPVERVNGVTVATDWHGSQVVFEGDESRGGSPNRSLYLLDLQTGTVRDLVNTDANEGFGTISPDGRWLAYASNATGEWEVYVETFPEAGGRWRISGEGGHQPRWNPRGAELFYISPDRRMMSVRIRANSGTFRWDAPQPLFQTDIVDLGPFRGSWGYAVAPEGDRFLILTRRPQGPSPAVAILNWR